MPRWRSSKGPDVGWRAAGQRPAEALLGATGRPHSGVDQDAGGASVHQTVTGAVGQVILGQVILGQVILGCAIVGRAILGPVTV